MGMVRAAGVVALQLVEVGQDFLVQPRPDGDQVADNPGPLLWNGVGEPAAVQCESLCAGRDLPHRAVGEQSPVVALPRPQCPVDEDRMLSAHFEVPLPLLMYLLYP